MAQPGTAIFPVAGLDDQKGTAFQMLGNTISDNFCALGGKVNKYSVATFLLGRLYPM